MIERVKEYSKYIIRESPCLPIEQVITHYADMLYANTNHLIEYSVELTDFRFERLVLVLYMMLHQTGRFLEVIFSGLASYHKQSSTGFEQF